MKTETNVIDLDPRRFQAPREGLLLPGSHLEERVKLMQLVIADLVAHPPANRNPVTGAFLPDGARRWERIRWAPVRSDGTLAEVVLSRDGVPIMELDRLITLLLGALDQRVERRRELEQLDKIAAAFAAFEDAPTGAARAAR